MKMESNPLVMVGIQYIRLAMLVFPLCTPLSCYGIEPGNYGINQTDQVAEIFAAEKQADRTIYCQGADKIDVGIKKTNGSQRFFTRDELREFFRKEKHKGMIWAALGPLAASEALAGEMEAYLASVGYRRILITGGSSFKVRVWRDTAASSH
ncbi:MAG TPA: hypothetical protein V6D17_06885 [Candidatus Obscuribacterales bacterium]